MAKIKPKDQNKFLSTNYEYFKVSKLDLFEFDILRDEIIESARRKKVIQERTIVRFFSLLKNEKDESEKKNILSDQAIAKGLNEALSFVNDERNVKAYDFSTEQKEKPTDLKVEIGGQRQIVTHYPDFHEMLTTVVQQLRVTESEYHKEWVEDKNFCMKEAFKEFVKFYWWFMSPGQRNKYKRPYKFIALSALLAHKVWRFGVSETKPKDMTMHKYNDCGIYALKRYNIDPNELIETPPNEWK